MIFDVLTEPWMGVVDKETGKVLKVGLRDYIVNAHMYKCSAENKDFAIVRRLQQRLAEAVVVDIYGRRVNDELMSAFNNGRFDANKVDAYFDECIKNGTSFDLFDEEKPFMQVDAKTAENVFKENSIASVSSINAKQCGGNNKVFFQHVDVNDYIENFGGGDNRDSYYDEAQIDGRHIEFANSVKFDEYMNLILMESCIAGMRGQSYVPGLICMPSPPAMYHFDTVEDKSLFSSILLNIAHDDSGCDDGIPVWKWDSYNYAVNSMLQKKYQVPLLEGMFFPVTYLRPDYRSIDMEKKTIKRIYKSIMLFKAPDGSDMMKTARQFWLINKEPSVTVIPKSKNKDVMTGMEFTNSNEVWMGIRAYANIFGNHSAPRVLRGSLYEALFAADLKLKARRGEAEEDETVKTEMTAYYVSKDRGSFLSQGKYPCMLPECILDDQLKKQATDMFIDMIGMEYVPYGSDKNKAGIAKRMQQKIGDIETALSSIGEQLFTKNKFNLVTVRNTTMNRYWRYCENLFKNFFIPDIDGIKKSAYCSQEEYMEALKSIVDKYADDASGYANKLIYSIPIPKGKSIAVRKALAKNGGKK